MDIMAGLLEDTDAVEPTLQYPELRCRTLVYVMLTATPCTPRVSNSWHQNVPYLQQVCVCHGNAKKIDENSRISAYLQLRRSSDDNLP
jgi:hypothetical protein